MTSDSIAPLPEGPVAEAPAAVEVAGPAAPTRLQKLLADVRHAGNYGQAQWLRWIENLRSAKPEVVAEPEVAAEPEALEPVASTPLAKRLLDSPQVLRAQQRGASLLLSLASAVRSQAEQLERGLKSLNQPSEADAVTG